MNRMLSGFLINNNQNLQVRFHLLLLSLLFVLVNGLLFWKLGIMTDYDTEGYFIYANEIKERGWFFKPHLFWYSGYALFIAMTSIYDSQVSVVLGQYFLSYLAMLSLYFAGWKLFKNPWAGFFASLWLVGFFMIQFWNLFLYAESLFISLNCFVIYFMVTWSVREMNPWNLAIGGIILVWAFITKPMGINILAGLLVLGFLGIEKRIKKRYIKWGLISFSLITFLALVNKMLETFGFIENYQIGEVVYNVHKLANEPYAKPLLLDVPESLFIPETTYPPILQLFFLIIMNPWYSLKLIALKLFFYLMYIRPYYSWIHNLLALVALLPMYFFFLKELVAGDLPRTFRIFSGSLILFSIVSISLMSVNWNSRFLMPVLPLVFLLGGNGIAKGLVSKLSYA